LDWSRSLGKGHFAGAGWCGCLCVSVSRFFLRTTPVGYGPDGGGIIQPTRREDAILRRDGSIRFVGRLHLDLCVSAEGWASLLPQQARTPTGTNSQVGSEISVDVRFAAGSCSFPRAV
jgi:hypothetical protein